MAGYGTDAEFEAFAEAHGYVLPEGANIPVLRLKGSDYVDHTYGSKFPGTRTAGYAQVRAWPRTHAVLASGETVPANEVPAAIITASFHAAWQEALAPGSLSGYGSPSSVIKRERVEGAVDVEYQTQSGPLTAESLAPVLTVVDGLLRPFLTISGGLPSILVV
jgi:hypothetical protein